MESVLKNELVGTLLAKIEERAAFEKRLDEENKSQDPTRAGMSAIATEILENASELDLRRLIFAALPDRFTSSDLYQVREEHPYLLQEVAVTHVGSFYGLKCKLADFILRHSGAHKTSRTVWRAHAHVSLQKMNQHRFGREEDRFCHTCVREFLCSRGQSCVLIEGPAHVIAHRLLNMIASDVVSIAVLDTLERIELSEKEAPAPEPLKKFRVIHYYVSKKTYEVLARNEEDASSLVNEGKLEPTEVHDPSFDDEQVSEIFDQTVVFRN